LSLRRKPESRVIGQLQTSWTPVFTGVTTFYGTISLDLKNVPVGVSLFKGGDTLPRSVPGFENDRESFLDETPRPWTVKANLKPSGL